MIENWEVKKWRKWRTHLVTFRMKSTQTAIFAAATRWKHFSIGREWNFHKKKNQELYQFEMVRTEPFKRVCTSQF